MRLTARLGLAALVATSIATAATAQQSKPAAPTQAQAGRPKAASPEAKLAEPVATVNGQPITRREVITLLAEFQIPPGNEQRAYDSAVDLLINTKLLEQFLQKSTAPPKAAEVDKIVADYRTNLQQQGATLESVLADTSTTPDEFKQRIARSIQWKQYVLSKATDPELTKYINDNKDAFSQTQLRASHILLKLEPDASAEQKAQAGQKLTAIKQEIEGGKISFADAANKYSEDDSNAQTKNGGDLGFFPRKGQFIEEFAAAAFALKDKFDAKTKKSPIAGPVETEYGLHLIQLTDIKPGAEIRPAEFLGQFKDDIVNRYASELQSKIVDGERKAAKIDRKPMPTDLFQDISAKVAAEEKARAEQAAKAGVVDPATKPAAAK